MKLLFVILDSIELSEEPVHEWINIGYLVSSVKHFSWLEVKVQISYIDDEGLDTIEHCIKREKPDVVAFSIYQYNAKVFQRAAQMIKRYDSNIIIIAGNVEISFFPEFYLRKIPEFDIALIDEGEETLPALMTIIKNKSDLSECKGIVYKKNGEIVRTDRREQIDNLDKVNFPDKSFYDSPLSTHFLICSRGCTGHCTFCSYKKGKVRRRSWDNIFAEISSVQKKYGAKYFHILDGAFGDGEEDLAAYYAQFYKRIRQHKEKFCFSFYMRAEQVDEAVTKELIKLKKVGLDYIMIGIETGNKDDLKIYGKKANLEDNIHALELLNKANIQVDVGWIMFNPYSSKEKLIQNIEFMKKYRVFLNASRLASRLAVYSGTPMVKMLTNDGLLNQSGDIPIVDGYNYNFKDNYMEKLWKLFSLIDGRVQEKSHMNYYKGQMTSAKILDYIYGVDCSEIVMDLQEYKKICMEYFYQLFYDIVENYDVPMFQQKLLSEVNEFIQQIEKIELNIEQKKIWKLKEYMKKKIKGGIPNGQF